ncbi:extensin-like domain-containing protein [Pseudooceanicola sp.]|uniref:extensin-like domain-containing protein n=1 Tax=Pseudooceanicola sp. TaxID=1914328 RepID=UPI000C0B17B8|nr:hypothetical protein [Pseudooceanicola sp.]|tara:strand:- start:10688 stop:11503 length:816 start_codon:yes stop_codon:yes gene_type:complete
MRGGAFLLCLVIAGSALAEPPRTSLRPVARGDSVGRALVGVQPEVVRPVQVVPSPQTYGAPVEAAPKKRWRLFGALRPKQRSPQIEKQGRAKAAARAAGAVCSDPGIQGVAIGRVPAAIAGCGVDEAVRVSSISGVALSSHAVMDCITAKSFKHWVDNGLKPAVKTRGGGVARIRVAAHYACRTRNNQPGARISEHGRGRAIDISGFTLRDGSKISVLTGWRTKRDSAILRRMHAAACGPFGTVLGPDSNRYHADHFHFDTARYRSGSYCR